MSGGSVNGMVIYMYVGSDGFLIKELVLECGEVGGVKERKKWVSVNNDEVWVFVCVISVR